MPVLAVVAPYIVAQRSLYGARGLNQIELDLVIPLSSATSTAMTLMVLSVRAYRLLSQHLRAQT